MGAESDGGAGEQAWRRGDGLRVGGGGDGTGGTGSDVDTAAPAAAAAAAAFSFRFARLRALRTASFSAALRSDNGREAMRSNSAAER